MRDDGERGFRSTLDELTDVIDVAVRLADTLGGDQTVQRVVEAFRLMPFEDRAVIAEVIEREVQARRLSAATERVTGQTMHPNPNARLYVRAHEKPVIRNVGDRDELLLATLAGLRVMSIVLVPEIHEAWIDGAREAVEHLEPPARRAAMTVLREALALLEEADASDESGRAARAI